MSNGSDLNIDDLNIAGMTIDNLIGDVVVTVADGTDLAGTSAKEAASSTLVWADGATNVADVAGQMMEQWVRHVLVEKDGDLIGIVSARDLIGLYASSDSD